MQQQQGIRITKFLIFETGTYNTQYRRPYETELQGYTLTALQDRLHNANGYVASAFGGIANDFIHPSATPEKAIPFFEGWQEKRFRFAMEVEYQYYTGGTLREMLLGYSSHAGITPNGTIDPRMEFHINSVVNVRDSVEHTPWGNQIYTHVADASHLLINPSWGGIYSAEPEHRLRPEDVYATMGRSQLKQLTNMLDTRTMVSTTAVKSRRSNGSAAAYMARVLDDYRSATVDAAFGASDTQLLDRARGFAAEKSAAKDPFLQALANVRNMGVQNVFTLNDLKSIDPNIEYVTDVKFLGPTQRSVVHQAGMTSHWDATNRETVTATILSQTLPADMMEVGLTVFEFLATNQDTGQIDVRVYNAQGFSNTDLTSPISLLKTKLINNVLADISHTNEIPFSIEMRVNLAADTWLTVSLSGGPYYDYVTPSFCDALLVPVLTSDTTRAETLASDFEQLSEALNDVTPGGTQSDFPNQGNTPFGSI